MPVGAPVACAIRAAFVGVNRDLIQGLRATRIAIAVENQFYQGN